MKKISKILALAGVFLLALGGLAGCGEADSGALNVVCTIFPQYDWTRTLADGNDAIDLTLLQSSGMSVTQKQIEGGANYLSLMEENLETLKTALN